MLLAHEKRTAAKVNQVRTKLPPRPATKPRRSATPARDRFPQEQVGEGKAAFSGNQWCDALHAPSAPNITAMTKTPPQQTITGRITATTARPVSVSCARARPME